MRIPKLCLDRYDNRAYARYPKTKRKQYFGTYGSPEAEAKYRDWLKLVLTGYVPPSGAKMHVIDLVDRYLAHCEAEWGRESTEFNLIFQACDRLLTIAANKPITELGPLLLKAYCDRMLTETYQKGKSPAKAYSSTYLSKCVSRIKRMVHWGAQQEIVPPEVYEKVKLFEIPRSTRKQARETAPVQPVPWTVVRATLAHLHSPIDTMVQVQFWCGMRPQDVCNLRPEDIERSGDVWMYEPHEHKNTHRGLGLMKAIPPSIQRLLSPFLSVPRDQYLFRPDQAPIFQPTLNLRARYTTSAYGYAVRRACMRARDRYLLPIPYWTPNQLRHGIATLIKEDQGHDAATAYLGHSTPDTTAIYAHRSREAVRKVAMELELRLSRENLPNA